MGLLFPAPLLEGISRLIQPSLVYYCAFIPSLSSMCEAAFKFTPPPEAPVFRPTLKEFEDPLLYLEKIRPIGIKTGICKIIPPKGWNPPFAVDVNSFRFTPRIQRLYELEAHSRLKLDFIGKLYQFFRLQGMEKLKIPNIGGQYLDIYWLHKHVINAGGYAKVNSAKLWAQMAERLGYPGGKFAMAMKTNYEKLLLKYELMITAHSTSGESGKRPADPGSVKSVPTKRTRLHAQEDDTKIDYTASKELKNLQFFGAGPKTVVPIGEIAVPAKAKQENTGDYLCRVCDMGNNEAFLLICCTSSCQACYHTYCLTPPLAGVPHYQWKCPECVRTICSRPMDSFGFPQSSKSYTLYEFGIRADAFKAKYFRREPSSVPCSEVEQEFWRILQEYTEDVVVEYGADVHASDQGSGFPTEIQLARAPHLFTSAEQRRQALVYAQSPWNLNNLPIYGNSVLRFIKGNVDGMKVPWCYVGMVFSTFCWHIEDHWSCSINFNHWGEPKTWYGVSSEDAELFERAMRKQAGELFDLSPDLLHHITTIMNPNLLQAEGVPIYRTDQHCGEFVVTFPRAYHAGFNQGFNFAEAVNVCPPAWLPIGRACVEHYAEMHRQCVFSNDELLFRLAEVIAGRREMVDCATYTEMAAERFRDRESASRTCFEAEDLRIIYEEFSTVVGREVRARRRLLPLCARAVQFRIDRMSEHAAGDEDDDERICAVCQTTLFFSAIACPCKAPDLTSEGSRPPRVLGKKRGSAPAAPSCADGKPKHAFMVCLDHVESVCECCPLSRCTLYYTHSLDELEGMRDEIAARMDAYAAWRRTFAPVFIENPAPTPVPSTALPAPKVTLDVFERQLKDAYLFGYHTDQLYKRANSYLEGVKDLLRVCERASDFILGRNSLPSTTFEVVESEAVRSLRSQQQQQQKEVHLLEFQLKRHTGTSTRGGGKTVTHILQRSIDLKNPREADFLSLLEAVELEEASAPIDLTRRSNPESTAEGENADEVLPSLANLRRLFHHCLPKWRAEVLAAVEEDAVQRDSLEHSPLSHLQSRLDLLVRQLRNQFPGWCDHSVEVKTVALMEEVCRWISASGEGGGNIGRHWCSLPGLRQYLSRGEELVSRLTSTSDIATNGDSGTLRNTGTRRHRGDGDGSADGSIANTSPLATVTVACRPLLEQLKARINTAISAVSQIFTQARSAFSVLVEKVEGLHLTEWGAKSSLSAVGQSLTNLARFGVHSVCEEAEKELAILADETGLAQCLTTCLTGPTESDHQHCHLRGGAATAEGEEDLASSTARLVFGWCAQVTNHFLANNGCSACSEKPKSWLYHLSDLIAVEKFILGNDYTKEGNSCVTLPSELDQCRRNFNAFCNLHLKGLHNMAGCFVDNVDSPLPLDLFNLILEATVSSSITNDTLLQLHQATFERDFEGFEHLLKTCFEAYRTKVRSTLANINVGDLCRVCRERLGFTATDASPPDACPLCPLLPARRDVKLLTVADLTQSMEIDTSDSSDHASQSLLRSVTSCTRFIENRYCTWLTEIDNFVSKSSETAGQFLSGQSNAFIDGLPDPLKTTASALCGKKVESMASANLLHNILLPLLVEGQTLSAVIKLPPACMQLLRGLLAF
ncbi:lysine specific demethylase 5A [Echinococcus multilocularis]|uniref:[histone H3]-trimethyl-L-lysine(4) demethylase n=1 Tax=Echinococcus multilocularis TaxID=6211 RepID=A0A068XZR0_ECHMU|nr:lysine specific demethylase 5A [Echinococcus multilocularis]